MLAHVGDVDGLRAALAAHLADDLMGHQAGRVGHGMIILRLPLADHGHPLRVLCLLDEGEHPAQNVGGIAGDGQIHIHVLAQLAGVDVDLDDGGIFRKGLGVQGHTVREAGAQCDEDIAVGHGPVGGVAAVHSHHADVHRVAVRHDACRHQGVGGGDLRFVDEVPQGLAGGCAPHTAAKVDQRPLGRVDEVGGPLDLFFAVRGHGADLFRLLGSKLADRSGHILGDVHEDGAFAAALRNAERGPHGVGQVFDPAHREIVLGDGHRDALDVGFLKAVRAKARRGDVAGEGDHGHRVHVGRGNAGDEVGGTRPAGGQHHAGTAGGAGITVCRMGGALLVGGQHMGDAVGVLVQLIVKVQHCAAGVTEDGIHPLLAEHLNKNLRTIQLHVLSLLFPVSFPTLHFQNSLRYVKFRILHPRWNVGSIIL